MLIGWSAEASRRRQPVRSEGAEGTLEVLETVPGRGSSKCKGPEVRGCVMCSRESKEASVARASGVGVGVGNKAREATGATAGTLAFL